MTPSICRLPFGFDSSSQTMVASDRLISTHRGPEQDRASR